MHEIVLSTLNARYHHSAFGLRCLMANMGELQERSVMLEFTIADSLVEVLADILQHRPRIVGLGVYIWNVRQMTELVSDLKRVSPDTVVVLGGPEVSYETQTQPITRLADYVICGEADLAFADLCSRVLSGQPPSEAVIQAVVPQFSEMRLPYSLYTDEDISHRVIYVEASRGCPFTCEFCLSALETPVRQADLEAFLAEMQRLLDRGVRQFKFVDRTFNLNIRVSRRILSFFLDRFTDGLFLHFEMIPDRLPEPLRGLIAQFPAGTFSQRVGELISRRQDNDVLEDNFRYLRQSTGVHLHADLIVGLPGEDAAGFGRGFDRLLALEPQEIQVGVLKRLKGTPIVRHDDAFEMVYSEHPPFEILSTRDVDFETMTQLRHFARTWDLVGNSGNFTSCLRLMWANGESPYEQLTKFSSRLVEREGRLHGISLVRLAEAVLDFLTRECGVSRQRAAEAVWQDYTRTGRSDRPGFLREFELPTVVPDRPARRVSGPARQRRHRSE